jgi:hypothetical protein
MDDSELGWMQIGKNIGREVAYDVSGNTCVSVNRW